MLDVKSLSRLKIEYQNIFCENSYKNLKVLESKIKTSKIEDTKKCLKNIKEKYKDFQKNDNDDVNDLFQNDDIKTFVQKVEATHNKWNAFCRAPRPIPSCLVPYLSLTCPLPIPYLFYPATHEYIS